MGTNDTNATAGLAVSAVSLPQQTGLHLQGLLGSGLVHVTLGLLNTTRWDPSLLLLWLIAVGTVVGGSYWAAHDYTIGKGPGKDQVEVGGWVGGYQVG